MKIVKELYHYPIGKGTKAVGGVGPAASAADPAELERRMAPAPSSAFMPPFGLSFAGFRRDLSHRLFPGLAVLLLNIAPFFSYARPIISPARFKAITGYDEVFPARDLVLNRAAPTDAGGPFMRQAAWAAAAA